MNLRSEKTLKFLSIILFIIYFGIMFWVIALKCNLKVVLTDCYDFFIDKSIFERINLNIYVLNPEAVDPYQGTIEGFIKDDIMNIIIFLPFGLYLGYFLKKENIFKVLGISFLVSFIFESIQLFSLIGSFGLNDLLTNTLGALIGYLAYKILYRKNNSPKKILVFNVITTFFIFIGLPILIYGIIGTIKIFPLYLDIIFRRL